MLGRLEIDKTVSCRTNANSLDWLDVATQLSQCDFILHFFSALEFSVHHHASHPRLYRYRKSVNGMPLHGRAQTANHLLTSTTHSHMAIFAPFFSCNPLLRSATLRHACPIRPFYKQPNSPTHFRQYASLCHENQAYIHVEHANRVHWYTCRLPNLT